MMFKFKFKSVLSMILAAAMLFSFAACGGQGQKGKDEKEDSASKIPSAVKEEIVDNVSDNYGYDASGLKIELDVSSNSAEMYLVSGQLKDECDEDLQDSYGDYEKGYFLSMVLVSDGNVILCESDIYEKDEKEDMQDEIDDFVDEYESDKEDFKEQIEEMCEMADEYYY